MRRDDHEARVAGVNERLRRRPTRAEFVRRLVEEARPDFIAPKRHRRQPKPTARG